MEHKTPIARDEQEKLIHMVGRQLAQHMPGFTGNLQINLSEGRYINTQILQKLKPQNN